MPKENSIGALKFPGGDVKSAQKVVEGLGNNGEFIPTATKMLEQLKKVGLGKNPLMTTAVGAGNLQSALGAVSSLRQKASEQPPPKEDPCALENRAKLTVAEREQCEYLDSIREAAVAEAQANTSTGTT